MIRKLILPAVAAVMLAGCASYQYRNGAGGDYYYGQPGTVYRYYDGPYDSYGYGYPSGWGGSIGYSYGYYPYGGGYYPYYSGGYSRYPRHDGHGGSQHHGGGSGHSPGPPDDRPAPWRNLDALRDRGRDRKQEELRPTLRSHMAPIERTAAPVRHSAPPQRPISGHSGGNRDGRRNPAR